MRQIALALFLGLFSLNLWAGALYGQTSSPAATESEQSDIKAERFLSSPRLTVESFIAAMNKTAAGHPDAMKRALLTMDLSDTSAIIKDSKGEAMARLLFSLLQVNGLPKLSSVATQADSPYLLKKFDAGNIELSRDAVGNWRFSADTLERLPDLFDAVSTQLSAKQLQQNTVNLPLDVRLRALMPEWIKGGFLLEYWQWLGLFLAIIFGSIADKLLALLLRLNLNRWKQNHPSFEDLDTNVLRPLGLMAMALIWWAGLSLLGLPDTALVILLVAVKVLVSLSGIWSAFRIVDIFDTFLINKATATPNKFDDLLVPMISKSLKVFVIVIGIIFAADNLNIDVTSLLAGLGLGGLAFALAAKDLLGNFFGSLTVLLDRPFHIGDWVIIGDVEGTVEEVGFRSTRIRTFYNSLITLPNSILTTTKIDNMGARRYRRMKAMLALTYDTPAEKIEAFCEGVRQLIKMHPYMRKDFYQVYFNEYGAASLDILVYVFWATPDWNTELRERHRFLLDILRLARQLNVEFAYPTQTLYLKRADMEHLAPGPFKPGMSQEDAFAMGQKEAQSIVDATLGDDIPGPVTFTR